MNDFIFQANNHSKWQIDYKEIAPALKHELQEVLKTYYDIGNILSIEQVAETEVNSNNFKITQNDNQIFFLRRHVANRDQNVINRTLNIIEFLLSEGVRVPQVVKNREGNFLSSYKNEIYTLFIFLPAHHYRGSLDELKSSGFQIGKLNKALKNLPKTFNFEKDLSLPIKTRDLRNYNLEIWKNIFEKAREKALKNPRDSFHKELLSNENLINQAVKDCMDNKKDYLMNVVHFDLHPHNLLSNGKEVVAILDFDSLRYLEEMRALGFAMHRKVRQYIIYNNLTDYVKSVAEARDIFIEAYREICDLNDEEISTAPYFIKDESLCRLTYAMKDEYFNNNPAWRQDLKKQISNIKEADYFK